MTEPVGAISLKSAWCPHVVQPGKIPNLSAIAVGRSSQKAYHHCDPCQTLSSRPPIFQYLALQSAGMLARLGPLDGHVPGNILAALCSTKYSGEYHWLIYVCLVSLETVTFYDGPWEYHTAEWTAMDSETCVALTKIGRLAPDVTWNDVDNVVQTIPMAVPDKDRPRFGERFTCLVWFREAVRKLHTAGILRVINVDALEEKLTQRATAIQYRRIRGLEPARPVVLSPSEFTY
ncbi:hypothetical protein OH77DRAFT_512759 [Trametes cingulata]|nr:hypothetical protein OH77DRAFT_512759 [Trametes cingulata]